MGSDPDEFRPVRFVVQLLSGRIADRTGLGQPSLGLDPMCFRGPLLFVQADQLVRQFGGLQPGDRLVDGGDPIPERVELGVQLGQLQNRLANGLSNLADLLQAVGHGLELLDPERRVPAALLGKHLDLVGRLLRRRPGQLTHPFVHAEIE